MKIIINENAATLCSRKSIMGFFFTWSRRDFAIWRNNDMSNRHKCLLVIRADFMWLRRTILEHIQDWKYRRFYVTQIAQYDQARAERKLQS